MAFKREDNHKKESVPESYRKPQGSHSRSRLKKKGAMPMPEAGYRTSKDDRGKHPSGYEEVLVHNTPDLDQIDPETEAARIASKVGGKKTEQIIEKADQEEIKVLNRGEY